MKTIIFICAASAIITGCASNQAYVNRWNEMWADIAIRQEYEKYSCASCAHALEGYSKDPPVFSPRKRVRIAKEQRVVKTPIADPGQEKQNAQRAEDEIRALSAKIDVLENALKTNATTTNVNQNLIVQQMIALKIQLAQLEKASSTAPEK
jgi:hypothetical protein